MDDIANLAGVNKSTVSRALAGSPLVTEETRGHIRRIAEEHGYIVDAKARSLRSGKTRTIAVVVPLQHDTHQPLSDPFFMEMVAHLADALADRGYDLLLSKVVKRSPGWLAAIERSRKADGIILIGQSLEHDQIAQAAAGGAKLVVWGARLADQRYVTVGSVNRDGGRIVTDHLIGRGRKSIAFVGDCRLPEIRQRYEGYRDALEAAGIVPDPTLVVPTQFEPKYALDATRRLIAGGTRFDGLVAASDVIAIAAIQALTGAGRDVPGDVAVTGYDDIAMAAFTSPPLTTIRQDIVKGAQHLAERMLAVIDGQAPLSLEMTPQLIVRGSS